MIFQPPTFETADQSVEWPPMYRVTQKFDESCLADPEEEIKKKVDAVLAGRSLSGMRIAVTAGSRGISGIDSITFTVIQRLQAAGGQPFIIPAMGSHGNGDPDKQRQIIADYGITEKAMGVPICSTAQTKISACLEDGTRLYTDCLAAGADAIVLVNKIKPHTEFKAHLESGLCKMLVVGLGNHQGAASIHRQGFACLARNLELAAEALLARLPILFGLAMVENAFDRPFLIEALTKEVIIAREKELLRLAKERNPRLHLDQIDVLIIDEIGKNISGAGMDANVTGRCSSGLNEGFKAPLINKIVVRGLSPKTHGNGVGIGMADFTTADCIQSIDLAPVYTNAIAASTTGGAKIPLVMANDQTAIAIAAGSSQNSGSLKIVRIKNTLDLKQIEVSGALLPEVSAKNELFDGCIESLGPYRFDDQGRLL